MMAMRIWISAVWRSGSRDMIRSPKSFSRFIRASTRLRTWYPAHFFQRARPRYLVARRISFREIAAGQSGFHARPFRRIGMIGSASRSWTAAWHRRVSYAPSAVTVSISSVSGIWDNNSGSNGLSTGRQGISQKCPERRPADWRRIRPRGCRPSRYPSPDAPCATRAAASRHACGQAIHRHRENGCRCCPLPGRALHSNVPRGINRFRGRPEHRYGICTAIFA